MFGSVEGWSVAITGCFIIVLFNAWALRSREEFLDTLDSNKEALYAISAFMALFIFQLVPLPIQILRFLSSGKTELIAFFSLEGVHPASTNPYATLHGSVKFLLYSMIFFMAVFISKDNHKLLRVIRAIIVFGFLLSIFALIQKATGNGKIYWFRELTEGGSYFGPYVNKNHFAGFVGMLIPLSIGVSMTETRVEKKVLYAFFSAIMCFSLLYSLSRGGMISLSMSMLVLIYFILRDKGSSKQIVVIGIVAAVVVSYLFYFGFDRIIDRFASDDLSLTKRFTVWKSVFLSSMGKYWFMGSGLGSFPSLSPMYHPEGISSYFDHAHNDYLEYLIENGIIGIALLGIAAILFVRRVGQSNVSRYETRWIVWSCIASITSIAVHSIVDFNLHITSNALLAAFILGIVYGSSEKQSLGATDTLSSSDRIDN